MRFDLLDEYSTLVPFGLGVSRNGAFQDHAVPAKAAKHGTIANYCLSGIRLCFVCSGVAELCSSLTQRRRIGISVRRSE